MMKLFSKNSNLCDHNSPTLQTDRQTTCDRNTALCTKVHRAVKMLPGAFTIDTYIMTFIYVCYLFMLFFVHVFVIISYPFRVITV